MDKKYDMLISALDGIAFTHENDPIKLKTMAREALKGFNSQSTKRVRNGAKSVSAELHCPRCKTIIDVHVVQTPRP